MSDNIKLIIEIPKEFYEVSRIMDAKYGACGLSPLTRAIAHGIPLDSVKTEIKAMFPPSGNWMYDEECVHEHTVCEVLADVLQILDSVGTAESEDRK